jgi:lipoprotein-anchoring transpeptidase ErfK/SrfK
MISELELLSDKCAALGIKPAVRLLLVSINGQTLRFFEGGLLKKAYVVSTSKRPPSNIKGSLGTPSGLHIIAEKIGAGSPPGIVFKGRRSTGFHFNEYVDPNGAECLVTSRILWLRGLEPGVNAGGEVDTHSRYIYIHGTNREDRLGTPQSAGCVVMNNLEIVELFEQMRTGDMVWIGP